MPNLEDAEVKFKLLVMNPESVLFDGEVKSVSSTNVRGKFDILPSHANFVALISDFLNIIDVGGKETFMKIETGVLTAFHNDVKIFLGVADEKE